MGKRIDKMVRCFLVLVLGCLVIAAAGPEKLSADAAVQKPKLLNENIVLYAGYENYQIKVAYLPKDSVVTYKSGSSKIASVSAAGIVTPLKKGTTTISIMIKNKNTYQLTLSVEVKGPEIEFKETIDYLNVSDTYQLTALRIGTYEKVLYSTSDPAIASVDAEGRITALAPGSVVVTAKAAGKSAKYTLEVGNHRLGTFTDQLAIDCDTIIWITLSDTIKDEKILLDSYNQEIFDCRIGNTIENRAKLTVKVKGTGQDKIVLKSDKTTDRLIIDISSVDKVKDYTVQNTADIYKKYQYSTVEIQSKNRLGIETFGTGFFIGEHMVATSIQAIEGAKKIQVTTADNAVHEVDKIIGYDFENNIAVLEVDYDCEPFELYPYGVKGGETIYILGNPLGLKGTMTEGIVSNPSHLFGQVEYFQTDAAVSEGSTGSPVLNKYGAVVGINIVYAEDGQEINFAVHIKELKKICTIFSHSVDEYHDDYKKLLFADMIHEDPELSSSYTFCQEVPSGIPVQGCVPDRGGWDYYRFTVTKHCTLKFLLETEDEKYLKDSIAFIEEANSAGSLTVIKYFFGKNIMNENGYLYFEYPLKPGKYSISLTGSYKDKPYIFYMSYN